MKTINLSDYGIHSGNERDLTARINAVFGEFRQEKDIRFLFERGTYHFYAENCPSKFLYISNHDEDAQKNIAMDLSQFSRLELDGGGSDFVFHTEILPLFLEGSKNVTLKNFSVDYARPSYSEGRISAVSEQEIEIEIDPQKYPWTVENGELIFIGENFRHRLALWLEMDALRKAPVYETRDVYFYQDSGKMIPIAEKISEGSLKLTLSGGDAFLPTSKVGNALILRHHPRSYPGIYVIDSENITCNSVNIYHTTGISFIAERTKNITLDSFNVVMNAENPRIFTAAADGTHFVNCSGEVIIKNSVFENQLDDAVNIHGIYAEISEKVNEKTLKIALVNDMHKGVYIGQKGDKIALVSREELRPRVMLHIEEIVRLSGDAFLLTTTETLPEVVDCRDVVENLTEKPSAIIENCVIRNNRARGILLTCEKVVVRDCVFETAGAAIYVEGEAQYWFESGCTSMIEIVGNVFRNCSYVSDWGFAPININPHVKHESGDWYFHADVNIHDNTFECFDERLLYVRNVGKLSFLNNITRHTTAFPAIPGAAFDLNEIGSFIN